MKKLNNKGVTLVELIVSFALVAVAIVYFYQTLYTVRKLYSTSESETQKFVDEDYALRIADAYVQNNCQYITCDFNGKTIYSDDKYDVTIVSSGESTVLYKCVRISILSNTCQVKAFKIKYTLK